MRIYSVQIVPPAAGIISVGPGRFLRSGSTVELWPLAENTATITVAADGDPGSLAFESSSMQIAVGAQAPLVLPVANLAAIVVKSWHTGDGVSVRVREP